MPLKPITVTKEDFLEWLRTLPPNRVFAMHKSAVDNTPKRRCCCPMVEYAIDHAPCDDWGWMNAGAHDVSLYGRLYAGRNPTLLAKFLFGSWWSDENRWTDEEGADALCVLLKGPELLYPIEIIQAVERCNPEV